MMEERKPQYEKEEKNGLTFWHKFGIACLAVVVAFFTVLVINL